MKITYITVCVNYLDFFALSYQHNKSEFDEFIVVTDLKDKATEDYCIKNNIKVVKTDAFYKNGAVFNKGLAINEAFKVLDKPEWIAFMDADTFVSPNFKKSLPPLDKEFFYGARRVLLPTFADYVKLSKAESLKDFEIPMGAGFGWFQLFHWDSSVVKASKIDELYPSFPDARESDWMFRNKWGDYVHGSNYTKVYGNYTELPILVYNLGEHGKNHFGRVTPNFLDKTK